MTLWLLLTIAFALLALAGYRLTPANAEKMRQEAKQRMPWL